MYPEGIGWSRSIWAPADSNITGGMPVVGGGIRGPLPPVPTPALRCLLVGGPVDVAGESDTVEVAVAAVIHAVRPESKRAVLIC